MEYAARTFASAALRVPAFRYAAAGVAAGELGQRTRLRQLAWKVHPRHAARFQLRRRYRSVTSSVKADCHPSPLGLAHVLHVDGACPLSGATMTQLSTGNARTLFFVAAKTALHKAGATGGTGASPAPVGTSVLCTKYASTTGASFIRIGS